MKKNAYGMGVRLGKYILDSKFWEENPPDTLPCDTGKIRSKKEEAEAERLNRKQIREDNAYATLYGVNALKEEKKNQIKMQRQGVIRW